MRLSELFVALESLGGASLVEPPDTAAPPSDPEVTSLFFDSRKAASGGVFVAVPGDVSDGHDHAAEAVASGAVALVVERPLDIGVPQVVVADSRAAMPVLAATFYNHPSEQLTVLGVTGTNGKTTIVSMLAAIATAAGHNSRVIGTLTGARTTPEAIDLQRELADAVSSGVDVVAMEVSSHALVQRRADNVAFDAVIFTNLTVDHLDYHESMDSYFEAKALLFEPGRSNTAVLWVDDDYGQRLADQLASFEGPPVAVPVSEAQIAIDSIDVARSSFRWRDQQVDLPMGGRFNVANAVLAAEAAAAVGIDPTAIARGLTGLQPVAGRFEPVECGQDFGVIVDYSHTPDSLRGALQAAKAVASGRVIVVFGAGGDRDHTKRPMMGAVACENADLVVLTSDNPRSERPDEILDQIEAGMAGDSHQREPDRRAAIRVALGEAQAGDVVLVAGKGHEDTQTIGTEVLPFDDRQVARELLADLGYEANA